MLTNGIDMAVSFFSRVHIDDGFKKANFFCFAQ